MRFTLPLPPSINATYRGAKGGGRLIYTDAAEAFVQEVGLLLNQRDDAPIEGNCVAYLYVFMRYENKGDHHNNHKLALDLLEGHAYKNDSQVVELHVFRRWDKAEPRVEIEVLPIDEDC